MLLNTFFVVTTILTSVNANQLLLAVYDQGNQPDTVNAACSNLPNLVNYPWIYLQDLPNSSFCFNVSKVYELAYLDYRNLTDATLPVNTTIAYDNITMLQVTYPSWTIHNSTNPSDFATYSYLQTKSSQMRQLITFVDDNCSNSSNTLMPDRQGENVVACGGTSPGIGSFSVSFSSAQFVVNDGRKLMVSGYLAVIAVAFWLAF